MTLRTIHVHVYNVTVSVFQLIKIIFDQHNGIKLKRNGVNVKHNR